MQLCFFFGRLRHSLCACVHICVMYLLGRCQMCLCVCGVYESVRESTSLLLKVWLRHSHSLHHQSALWCLSASPRTPTASLLLLPPLLRCQNASLRGGRQVFPALLPVKDTRLQLVTVRPAPRLISSFVGTNIFDG